MATRALVTGGAGFIGSHLTDLLIAEGCEVVVLDDLSTGSYRNVNHLLDHPSFEFVEGTVLDPVTVERLTESVDVVYHLAAAVGVQLIIDKPLQSLLTNIKGTENVLEAAERHRRKILIASTSEIYGKSTNGPFREDDDRVLGSPRKLRWSYSTSKAVDEILAYLYHRERLLPTVVVRLFNTVGPRQTGHYGMVIPRFVTQALRNEPLTVYGDGRQSRSFTYVGDVVMALFKLMQIPEAEGDVFNIAGSNEITIADLARKVIEKTGSSSPISLIPFDRVYGEDFEDMTRRVADTTRLRGVLGYSFQTTLDEILDRMVDYSREHLTTL